MITDDQRDEFRRTGLLRRPGRSTARRRVPMVDRIGDHLERAHGMRREQPGIWTTGRPTGLRAVTGRPEFRALGSPVIRAALDDLLGDGTRRSAAASVKSGMRLRSVSGRRGLE